MLIVMAGLPGSGKSTIADAIASELKCAVLSVDPIEAALWRAGVDREQPTGLAAYVVAEDVARAQLLLGLDVVVDAVNDVAVACDQWRVLAQVGTVIVFVEVHCSDSAEHRRRLESRERNIPDFAEPSWASVLARRTAFDDWTDPRVRVDSMVEQENNVAHVLAEIARARSVSR